MEHHTVPDEQHPPGVGGSIHGVGDHEDGLTLAIDLFKHPQKIRRGRRIQGTGGLVRQEQLGAGDHGPGHGGALLLAAGYLIGELVQDVLDAQRLGQGQQGLLHLLHTFSRQNQGQEDIVLNGKGIQQVELLEYKAQVVPAEGGQVPLRDGLQTFA